MYKIYKKNYFSHVNFTDSTINFTKYIQKMYIVIQIRVKFSHMHELICVPREFSQQQWGNFF
jgi:hypothetical protein